jgi:two-component system, chemotaxis family, chemotaxis protein CheY
MKVLVVDDEVDIQDLFLQKFRKEIRNGEVTFSFAISGESALDYLHKHKSEAILILSDINMPGMSGIELLRKIVEKNIKPKPTIMMITAYGDDDTRNRAMSLGADDFLNKPLDFFDLKERLFKHLNND